MNCPVCSGETRVIDSIPDEDSRHRRRECRKCKHRFSTVEIDADYYEALKPPSKKAVQEALQSGCAELTRRVYRALNFDERKM